MQSRKLSHRPLNFRLAKAAMVFDVLETADIPACFGTTIALNFHLVPQVPSFYDILLPETHMLRAQQLLVASKYFRHTPPGTKFSQMSYTADASGSETIFQPYPHIQYQADDVFIRLLPSDTLFDTNLPEDSVLLPVAQTGLFVPIPKMRAMIHGFYTLAGKGQGQAKAWVENIVDYADLEDSFEGELPPKESEDLKRRINTKSIRMRGKRERIDKGLGYKGAWKGKPWPLDML